MKKFKIEPRECEICPLCWEYRGLEDVDAGCFVSRDFEINKWCYIPKFLCEIKRKQIEKIEQRHWDKEAAAIEKYFRKKESEAE